jgi:membrane-associated phospholipid phosphatase
VAQDGARTEAASLRSVRGPLLPSTARPVVIAVVAVSAAVTAILGALFAHRARAGWLDAAIDAQVRASLGGHRWLLNRVEALGTPIPVIAMTAALALACLVTRRWRGAVLVAVAVPAAEAVTEILLKPLIGRTLGGGLSFPSGHATGVFALATAVVILLAGPLRPPIPATARLLLALAAVLAAGAVAIAVVGLGYHYFTDTVGGATVAIGMVLGIALVLDMLSPPSTWRRALIQVSMRCRDAVGRGRREALLTEPTVAAQQPGQHAPQQGRAQDRNRVADRCYLQRAQAVEDMTGEDEHTQANRGRDAGE